MIMHSKAAAVFHVASELGTDPLHPIKDAQFMYDGLVEATRNVLDSIEKAGTVQRLIYTSSCAAVKGPCPPHYVYTEDDWAGKGPFITDENMNKKWGGSWTVEKNAYAIGKVHAERMVHEWGAAKGIEAISCCPDHVIGPLLAKHHDTIWQHRLGMIFCGRYSLDMMWNMTDVRDVAQCQRLMAESPETGNGSRFICASPGDGTGQVTARQLVETLQKLFPNASGIGGSKPMTPDRDQGLATCMLAEQKLGLRCHIVNDTLKDTINTLESLGCLQKIRDRAAAKKASQERSKL